MIFLNIESLYCSLKLPSLNIKSFQLHSYFLYLLINDPILSDPCLIKYSCVYSCLIESKLKYNSYTHTKLISTLNTHI